MILEPEYKSEKDIMSADTDSQERKLCLSFQ